ncbi:MAG: acetylxylan esterase [Planctomycetaceae bacterium]|jgi:cephalosporin-C deacetylase-like acetyl esterase|nr:acetylxylan esterase [Planctomycetaceae bacterium]
MRKSLPLFFAFLFLLSDSVLAQEAKPQLPPLLTAENGYSGKPTEMMQRFLLAETAEKQKQWTNRYETLKTVEDITAYQNERREYLKQMLGKTFNRNTPLNPQVLKTFDKGTPGKDAYKVEMLVFESVPKFYVSAAVFIPDETKFKPPYPAVLVVCGHSNTGKAFDLYQRVPALAATNGLLAMSIDPIDQGERSQRLTEDGKPAAQGVAAHNVIGAGSILLGRNAATFEYWDMVRAIDYLQSRADVVKEKIGVTGTSGGGTQTSYLMSLDDRIAAAVPSCYLCNLFSIVGGIGPQDAEQNIFGQLAFGIDHADYAILRAPKPTLLETTTKDFFPAADAWAAFRNAQRIFDRFGFADRAAIIETDGEHGWHKNMRVAAVRWFLRWLANRDEAITEADDMPVFPAEEFKATETGEVLKLPEARSAFDLNRDYNEELLQQRKTKNEKRTKEELAAVVRKVAGIRLLADIPLYAETALGDKEQPVSEPFTGVAAKIERHILLPSNSAQIRLPAFSFEPMEKSGGVVLYLNGEGKGANLDKITEFLKAGKTVWAVDLRGLGETQYVGPQYYQHKQFGTDGTDYYRAYLLGKSYAGMRAEDILAAARFLSPKYPEQKPEVFADGETVAVAALHAAVAEPALFSRVKLEQQPRSWYDAVKAGDSFYPITNIVHGALLEYDLPDLQVPEE